jgi:phosphonoacetaldehyde hydrolase
VAAAAMVKVLRGPMEEQGLRFDHLVASDEVAAGRPAPDMIRYLMAKAQVTDPSCVVKVGDTPVDIAEGRNAGAWSIGILRSSNELGLSAEDFSALAPSEQRAALDSVRRILEPERPHFLLTGIEELPAAIEEINQHEAKCLCTTQPVP